MKKQMCFSLMLVVLLLIACQPMISFTIPQPADVAPLSGFPKRIQGKYLSSEDSSVLQITSNSVIRVFDFYRKVHVSQLDSNQQIIGDTLFDLQTNSGELIQIEGDSIVTHINEIDTLFAIDKQNVLKKFKGYYFLNTCFSENTWEVKKLGLLKGTLILGRINREEDLDQLRVLTETPQDSTPYVFSPTRKEFKKFVRNDGFRENEEFIKIKE